MDRVIGHIDLDYFYAQVEEVEDPSLRSKPVVVCVFSGRTDDSGAVATSNYRARELGVHSGMPIIVAKKKLEGVESAIIRMDHAKYEVVSDRIMEVVEQNVDTFEQTGIDEAFFDLTSSTGGDYQKARYVAESIKASILRNERLTCSVGLGRSKVVAKLGSEAAKPGGLVMVPPDDTRTFLDPLPVARLFGVGPKTLSELDKLRISTIASLASAEPGELERHFGKKFSAYLLAAATGTDSDAVVAGLEPTQFSRIITLKHDTRNPREAFEQLSEGIEYVHRKLITSSKSFRTITALGILVDLSTKTRSRTFEAPVNDAGIIRQATLALIEELAETVAKDFRRVGLRVSGLTGVEDQTSLSEFLGQAE